MKFGWSRLVHLWRKYEAFRAGFYAAAGATAALYLTQNAQRSAGEDLRTRGVVTAAELVRDPQPPSQPPSGYEPRSLVGQPIAGSVRTFDGFVCAYDRRTRIPLWVMEHLTPDRLGQVGSDLHSSEPIDRSQFDFYEDLAESILFRATNEDYLGSGFDRGHMAAAGNHRFDRSAMSQTFILSNIAPQVGHGFNRNAWNDLEKYIRAIARKSHNVVVVTGPLFLPRPIGGKKYVTYEVIGPNNVAVPTHFFKAIAIQERPDTPWEVRAWAMPNEALKGKVKLRDYQVPLNAVESAAGLQIFPGIDRQTQRLR
ncbi:unnamed protein product [Calicophoron daubneyi]|uniref:Endonuclease n=1 Tax=Calicophoron daubneyi TaxID=300641 RepID=A0AAV2TZR1_CALDB